MSKHVTTHFAQAHVGAIRRKITRAPTWDDVADAYDAGLNHALHSDSRNRTRLMSYVNAMRVVNAEHKESAP
jgi:hypothetical protein